MPTAQETPLLAKMGPPLHDDPSKQRAKIKRQWYRQLKRLVSLLDEIPDRPLLDRAEQQRLGIRLLNSSCAGVDDSPYPEPEMRFFTPILPENLPISPCCPSFWTGKGASPHKSLWPRTPFPHPIGDKELEAYYDGWDLSALITSHLRQLHSGGYHSPWQHTNSGVPRRRGAIYCERGGEQKFLVRDVFDMFSKRKPHQILLMVSSHPIVEGDSLLRSELLAMTSYMKWKMRVMEREQSLVCPVMVISIMTPYKVRILQGHFDGVLNVHVSKVFDFAVDDHEPVMNTIIGYLRSIPHGDTALSTRFPILRHNVHVSDENNEKDADEAKKEADKAKENEMAETRASES
ncbi:conserved hypothetical protein [Histoplasma capsulatum var. duboisii H88]|uniref:Uncharacterized protein n=1 Tax=Ajellomyces capsulatus (strain H88) TaxID=544711 RepID=F0UTP7_AJEC8|nr:conserved hypothetical protein [Histoplasma capsulatum var. duboisii H88]QSS57896.1 hypothetical protein I7I53_12225 [Histoplasma capsulatum var. duboisii H88]